MSQLKKLINSLLVNTVVLLAVCFGLATVSCAAENESGPPDLSNLRYTRNSWNVPPAVIDNPFFQTYLQERAKFNETSSKIEREVYSDINSKNTEYFLTR